MNVQTYLKAIVPVVVAGLLYVVAQVGVGPEVTLKEAFTLIVTGIIVYLTPNRK